MCLSSGGGSIPAAPPAPEPGKDTRDVTRRAKDNTRRRASFLAGLERTNTTGSLGLQTKATTAKASLLGAG